MLGWMAGTAAATWILPRRWQVAAISLVSAGFLSVYAPLSGGLLAAFALGSHFALGPRPGTLRLGIGLALIVAVLAGFKLGVDTGPSLDPALPLVPLGLSYFSLRVLHYMIERYKGALPPHGCSTRRSSRGAWNGSSTATRRS
jgi:hypothetical protein